MQAPADATVSPVTRDAIAATERLIRPHIRHTPIIQVDAGDLGFTGNPLILKLEFLQHTGSFKPRGAFANLLTRDAPASGSSRHRAAITASRSLTPRCGSGCGRRSLCR